MVMKQSSSFSLRQARSTLCSFTATNGYSSITKLIFLNIIQSMIRVSAWDISLSLLSLFNFATEGLGDVTLI